MDNKFWQERSVFITGGMGFLGGALADELIKQGAKITALVRDWTPKSEIVQSDNIAKVNLVRGGLEDIEVVERALNEYEIDTIFHLGAQAIVSIANVSPLSTFESNIRGTWNLLEAARRVGKRISRIVVASSDKAYGRADKLPYDETMPLRGEHPYDVSKSCADLISQAYFNTYRLPIAITRCGNIYGGGDLNYNRLIPGTIRSLLRGEAPIIRSDGTYIRDYFYLTDTIGAYMLLAEKMDDKSIYGEAFNFSTGERFNVLEVAELINKLMPKEAIKPKILNEVKSEIKEQSLSSTKAKDKLGWSSSWKLAEGLAETIKWYRENN